MNKIIDEQHSRFATLKLIWEENGEPATFSIRGKRYKRKMTEDGLSFIELEAREEGLYKSTSIGKSDK